MGGSGSGHYWRHSARPTTSDFRAIDVRRWKRGGLLNPGQSFGWNWSMDGEVTASIRVRTEPGQVRLIYKTRSYGDEWENKDYPVRLDWTPCHLGGERPWFRCPALGCGRRVAILHGGTIFACRNCHGLAYQSQREKLSDRAIRQADRIRDRLGWHPGVANGHGPKPKGMHWRTFERLCDQHDAYERASWGWFLARYGADALDPFW